MSIKDLFSSEEQIIGIDFNNPLRVIHAGRKRDKIIIKHIHEERLSDDIFQGIQFSNPEPVREILKRIIKSFKLKKGKVLFSIPAQNTAIRFINFTYMPEEELREALRWELERFIPFPVEDVYFDYQILNITERENTKEYQLLLVASPSEILNSFLNILRDLNLEPELIDISFFCAIRTAIKEIKDIPKELTLFIYAREKFVDLLILKNKTPLFFRSILTKNWFEDEELDELSRSYALDEYLREIYRNINIFYSQYPEERVEKLILLGDIVLNKDFIELLESMLGLKAEISPLSLNELNIQVKNKDVISIFQKELPKWSVPLGLLFWGEA
ncbi:MAG: pilus assembly protein PilM [Dictyoglomus sp.]|nr:pilus assembly protein PilM [Dictyoglomus sp.]MCX7941802.1 pilus assembly protein PilM [Dictyoglomaceae bacterium]MDW8188095.1 pilus assembly protein PilM [Dictyoglomus sp.]